MTCSVRFGSSFFHATSSTHPVFCLFSTVYDRTNYSTDFRRQLRIFQNFGPAPGPGPYEIFRNFGPGPCANFGVLALASGLRLGHLGPGILAGVFCPRYLGQLGQVFGPCPWPPAPVRRGICHQILEVFVTKFSKSIAFDLCSKNSDIAVSNASCLFIHSENFRGSNTSKLLRTFVSSSL